MPWQVAKRHLVLKKTPTGWMQLIFLELLLVLLLYSLGHTMGWILGGVVTPSPNSDTLTTNKPRSTAPLNLGLQAPNASWRQGVLD